MEGKKNCGNGNVEMQGKKMWQLICGNGVAENWEEGEKEREFSRKKNILDSYSKKYTYFYSFCVSVVFFFTETVWFVCRSCSFISYCKSILCMIFPMKQIMNLNSSTLILILKKKKST